MASGAQGQHAPPLTVRTTESASIRLATFEHAYQQHEPDGPNHTPSAVPASPTTWSGHTHDIAATVPIETRGVDSSPNRSGAIRTHLSCAPGRWFRQASDGPPQYYAKEAAAPCASRASPSGLECRITGVARATEVSRQYAMMVRGSQYDQYLSPSASRFAPNLSTKAYGE